MSEQKSQELEIVSVPQDDKGIIEVIPLGSDERIKLSIKIVRDLIAVPTKTGKLPTDKDCIKFMMLARARHLNPFEGDAFMLGYDTQTGPQFSLITAHQVFLKRAEASKGFTGMESGVIVEAKYKSPANMTGVPMDYPDHVIVEREGDLVYDGEKLIGGWAKVYRKDREKPFYRRLKLSTFNTGRSRWEKDPAGMICKCAEADALRTAFPTHLGGLYIEEESPPITVGPTIKRALIEHGTRGEPAAVGVDVKTNSPKHETLDQTNLSGGDKQPSTLGSEAAKDGLNTGIVQPDNATPPAQTPSAPKKKSSNDIPSTNSPLIPKRKAKAKVHSSNDVPYQNEMLALLNLGGYKPEDLISVCRANEWINQDEVWPLSEARIERLLLGDNKAVLIGELDGLRAEV